MLGQVDGGMCYYPPSARKSPWSGCPGRCMVVDSASTVAEEETEPGDGSATSPVMDSRVAAAPVMASHADPGDEEARMQQDLLLEKQQEAAAEYEEVQAEEALYDEQRWESYLEAREQDAASSGSEASTVRLTRRKWEDMAMADQLQWTRSQRLRPPDNGAQVSLPAGSINSSEHASALPPVASEHEAPGLLFQDPLSFVQSPLGVVLYQWWAQGLVPSITVAADLGLPVLEAFRNQRKLLN